MLVVDRKPGEKIMIGPDISVIVLGVKGRQVRIGVDAPRSVEVDREEIRRRKDAERQQPPVAA